MFEHVNCYYCGSDDHRKLLEAEEDLTGKPGTFVFVVCNHCGLTYQNPRVDVENIKFYYDDEYIAHRKQSDWGVLQPAYDWAMGKYDRDKDAIVSQYVELTADSRVLDVGCAVGTFLTTMQDRYGARISGVDFKDCSYYPGFERINFHCGLFYEQTFEEAPFDLITMWHFLEHDYDPMRSLETAHGLLSETGRLIIEVPRLDSATYDLFTDRWPGLQAPQHTVLLNRRMLTRMVEKAGFEVVDYLPYGAFPAYFYLFCGVAFKILKGKGIDISQWIYPYFLGQLLVWPLVLFERDLNLAMQTIVCRKRRS